MRARHDDAGLRDDVREAIELSLPDNVVELTLDPDDSYFCDVRPKLAAALGRIAGTSSVYEREPKDDERLFSYYLFFVSPQGDDCTYAAEIDTSEAGESEPVPGEGRVGLAVAVSLLAPFAVIAVSALETFEDGTQVDPRIGPDIEIETDAHAVLSQLRERVATILDKHWITVLPEEEWRKPVPWLIAGATVMVEEPVRVLDALFFEFLDV